MDICTTFYLQNKSLIPKSVQIKVFGCMAVCVSDLILECDE